jgi:hypothetical protein
MYKRSLSLFLVKLLLIEINMFLLLLAANVLA